MTDRRALLSFTDIQAMAASLKRSVSSLLVLSADVDPYRAEHPSRRALGEWFADLWNSMECGPGTHLRRLHYLLISQVAIIRLPNGTRYLNDVPSWKTLIAASGPARFNGLVDPRDIVDRKNPQPIEYLADGTWPSTRIANDGAAWGFNLPGLALPRIVVENDEYLNATQRYHIECWAEKSTQNDILLPLARRYRLNLCTFNGEVSTAACFSIVERALRSGRPARVLYISDFDPAGQSMPTAAARKVQRFVDQAEAEGRGRADIQINPIILTPDQCRDFGLPRTPIKKSERRAAKFEERFGEGATELDALVALHPGAFERIVLAEVQRFHDPEVDDAYKASIRVYRDELAAATRRSRQPFRAELEKLQADYDALQKSIARRGERLRKRADPLFAKISERLRSEAAAVTLAMPDACTGTEWEDPLYNSARDYLEQVDRFRVFQGEPDLSLRRAAE